jgi:bifunctional non-homologous end joining protein LigD
VTSDNAAGGRRGRDASVRSLDAYRARRLAAATPEPVPAADVAERVEPGDHTPGRQEDRGERFVIQEHHARALHWDVRLERDGVLVSWAVPRGLPLDQHTVRLAKPTEDHPLEYADFEGEIPRGQYGAGTMTIWDRGTYVLEGWSADRVAVELRGERVRGRYLFFRAGRSREAVEAGAAPGRSAPYGPDDWMVRRMDPPEDPTRLPMPTGLLPMGAVAAPLPTGPGWAYEIKWDGMRVLAFVDGGRVRAFSRTGKDVTAAFPELRAVGAALGSTQAVLDGEIVAFGPNGRPDFHRLAHRMHIADATAARRLASQIPVSYLIFDLLFLDGHLTTALPYDERRVLLAGLPGLTLSEALPGDGPDVLRASAAAGLEGVVAKRRSSGYQPGRRSADWVKVKNTRTQTVVIGGWEPGEGARAGRIGSLLVGVAEPTPGAEDGDEADLPLRYAGHVGTGFSDSTLDLLSRLVTPLRQDDPPFRDVPAHHIRKAVWVRPELVAEVEYAGWTDDARMRHPSFKGLRDDRTPTDTVPGADTHPG